MKKVSFSAFASMNEIISVKDMNKKEIKELWYHPSDYMMFKKETDLDVLYEENKNSNVKVLEEKRDMDYFVSKERSRQRMKVIRIILKAQKVLEEQDLAFLYFSVSKKEKENALKRAYYYNRSKFDICSSSFSFTMIEFSSHGKRTLHSHGGKSSLNRQSFKRVKME